jgi:hypothetical protein
LPEWASVKIQLFDEHIDDPDRVVLCDIIVQALRYAAWLAEERQIDIVNA